jgi:hypothetical protein
MTKVRASLPWFRELCTYFGMAGPYEDKFIAAKVVFVEIVAASATVARRLLRGGAVELQRLSARG